MNIPKPSDKLYEKLSKYLAGKTLLPIDRLFLILHEEYSRDQLAEMEAEFLLQHLLKDSDIKEEDVDSIFINKLYAITSILKQPMLVTHSLLAFYNTVLICNGMPAGISNYEDVNIVPSYFLGRTMMALDVILADDMDPTEMYMHPNIKTFIFDCHKQDDNIFMGPTLERFQDQFFTYTYSDKTGNALSKIASALESELMVLKLKALSALAVDSGDATMDDQRDLYKTLYDKDYSKQDIKTNLAKQEFTDIEVDILEEYPADTYKGNVIRKAINTFMYAYLYGYSEDEISNKEVVVVLLRDSEIPKLKKESVIAKVKYIAGDMNIKYCLAGNKLTLSNGMTVAEDQDISSLSYKYIEGLDDDPLKDIIPIFTKLYKSYGPPSLVVLILGQRMDYEVRIIRGKLTEAFPNWDIILLS